MFDWYFINNDNVSIVIALKTFNSGSQLNLRTKCLSVWLATKDNMKTH